MFNRCLPGSPGRSLPALSFLLSVLSVILAGCAATGADDVEDWAGAVERQLLADGEGADIVSCVRHVGRNDLRRGPLSIAAIDELVTNCRAALNVIDGAEPDNGTQLELAMIDVPWTFGDDPVLDDLWTACESGTGAACDELFERSPVGSEYENFGVSCGQRPSVLDCAELDRPQP